MPAIWRVFRQEMAARFMRGVVQFLSDFADQAVILPLALAVAVGLALLGWRRGAIAWGASVVATLVLLGALKLLAGGCDLALPGLVSPSGHTASAAMVYGGLWALWRRRQGRAGIDGALAGAVLVAALIGLTRLALHVHSVPDVIAGGLIGLGGVVLLLRLAGAAPRDLKARRLVIVGVVAVLVSHGSRWRPEPDLRWASLYLSYAGACDILGLPARADAIRPGGVDVSFAWTMRKI